jgi:hypothetical protein
MSTTFTITRDQVIQSALRKLGVLELGDTPDAATVANASLALNLFIKQMSTKGIKLWKINELVLPLVAGQSMYVIGPSSTGTVDLNTDKPLKVIQAWLRDTSTNPSTDDVQIQLLSKQEYNMLGSKFSTGTPNSIFMDIRNNTSNLYVYVTPDSYTQANKQLHFVVQQPLQDIMSAQSTPDFPNEWMNVLVWNLADQLAIEYSPPVNKRMEIAARAKQYKEELEDWDVESYSTFFMPDMRMGRPSTNNLP